VKESELYSLVGPGKMRYGIRRTMSCTRIRRCLGMFCIYLCLDGLLSMS
jgi:hypothetical protein